MHVKFTCILHCVWALWSSLVCTCVRLCAFVTLLHCHTVTLLHCDIVILLHLLRRCFKPSVHIVTIRQCLSFWYVSNGRTDVCVCMCVGGCGCGCGCVCVCVRVCRCLSGKASYPNWLMHQYWKGQKCTSRLQAPDPLFNLGSICLRRYMFYLSQSISELLQLQRHKTLGQALCTRTQWLKVPTSKRYRATADLRAEMLCRKVVLDTLLYIRETFCFAHN